MATQNSAQINPELVQSKAETAFGAFVGSIISANIYLGDRLGLYAVLKDAGPVSAGDLAEKTGYKERWVLEWLRGQVAGGLLTYRGNDTFEMTPEEALVLADDSNPASMVGTFQVVPVIGGLVDRMPQAFKTGLGYSFDTMGAQGASWIEAFLGPYGADETELHE